MFAVNTGDARKKGSVRRKKVSRVKSRRQRLGGRKMRRVKRDERWKIKKLKVRRVRERERTTARSCSRGERRELQREGERVERVGAARRRLWQTGSLSSASLINAAEPVPLSTFALGVPRVSFALSFSLASSFFYTFAKSPTRLLFLFAHARLSFPLDSFFFFNTTMSFSSFSFQ